MSTYRIQSGDSLWRIARRMRVSVQSLRKANPRLRSPSRIFAGQTLNLPGKAAAARRPAAKATGRSSAPASPAPAAAGSSGGGKVMDIARAHLGINASSAKLAGDALGRAMEDWVPNTVNCANFVSGALEAAGQITHAGHSASVVGLIGKLDRNRNFKRVTLHQAKPGDVVSFKTTGGHHVVLFAGWKNGKPYFLGSNNINSDGTQRISYSTSSYPILAIHHYRA